MTLEAVCTAFENRHTLIVRLPTLCIRSLACQMNYSPSFNSVFLHRASCVLVGDLCNFGVFTFVCIFGAMRTRDCRSNDQSMALFGQLSVCCVLPCNGDSTRPDLKTRVVTNGCGYGTEQGVLAILNVFFVA